MITKEMKEKGTRCRGRGFNCATCSSKESCADYENPTQKINKTLSINQLSEEEKNLIFKHRLKLLTTGIDTGQYKMILSNADNKVLFAIEDKYEEKSILCYLDENQLDEIFNFLSTRHKLQKQLSKEDISIEKTRSI